MSTYLTERSQGTLGYSSSGSGSTKTVHARSLLRSMITHTFPCLFPCLIQPTTTLIACRLMKMVVLSVDVVT
ncbi:hypothetical protein K439DRAFT_1638574 [Ramaria rubella]|nr:hypothetical protein K439DRAFT_1638574 [Ramaria rubella]